MSVDNMISLAAQYEELAGIAGDSSNPSLEHLDQKNRKLVEVKMRVQAVIVAAKKLEQQYANLSTSKKGPISGFLEKHLDTNHIGTIHTLSECKKKLDNAAASLEQSKVPLLGKL